ncbi:hypothetical protein F4825DRAFT_307815 [Nemania diffusa]|nr:hypothetical protein F4825DRAFT_307815 [Nemania diffusa]
MPTRRGDFMLIENPSRNSASNFSPMPSGKPSVARHSWWWWWDIMALVTYLILIIGLVILLKSIDNKPLRSWVIPIQPNTVIAALATVSKAALLVPIASCLSQLKWHHFTSAPRKLADLQLFDQASRGPWGSLVFLFQVSSRLRALVAVGFSLLTILALGLDASTQQLLKFPTQETELTDDIVMGAATGYISKSSNAEFRDQALNSKIIPLQYEILNSLRGSTFNSYFNCPPTAARCTWDNITTLGVCSSWNSASIASDGCDMTVSQLLSSNSTYAVCNYTLSNHHSGNAELAAAAYPATFSLSYKIPSVDFNSRNKVLDSRMVPGPLKTNTEFGEFSALKAPANTNFSTQVSFNPPLAEAFYASFWWCQRSYQGITVEPDGIKYAAESSELLHYLFNTSITTAAPYGYSYTYAAESTGLNYTIEGGTYEALTTYMNTLLSTTAEDQSLVLADASNVAIGALLYLQDLENMTTSIADSLTNIMRSRTLDENFNITDVPGRAFYDETYIQVQWIWLLHPLGEAALVTLLFIFCVVVTSKQPLLKDSVLAYLATTVKDDMGKTSGLSVMRWTSQGHLNDVAEDIIVKLEPDEQGQMEFSRKHN